jgi:hypothetical protein
MSMVQQAIEVSAPLHTVYQQLAAFENYSRFMSGVREVTPIGPDQTHWIMDVDGKRREFDAQITERSLDERVSWSTTEGPLLAETLTLRPMGETKTQIVAQLEADVAFLMPSDRHGQASLTKRLKSDLSTFKTLVESGALGAFPVGASSKQLSGRSAMIASPATVAARIRNRPHPDVDLTSAPGIHDAHDLDDVLAPGRRVATAGPISGGVAGMAEMGGRPAGKDAWGDGMINEEERGSAHDM